MIDFPKASELNDQKREKVLEEALSPIKDEIERVNKSGSSLSTGISRIMNGIWQIKSLTF